MKYIFFYRYADGTEGFGFYDEQEARDRMEEFKEQAAHYDNQVEFGIACVESVETLNLD